MDWPSCASGMLLMQHCTTWLPWLFRTQDITWPFSWMAISTFDSMVGRLCTADHIEYSTATACCFGPTQAGVQAGDGLTASRFCLNA